MATSGSFEKQLINGLVISGGDVWAKCEWTRTSYSQVNNTSTISFTVYLREDWGHIAPGYPRFEATIDGKTTSYTATNYHSESGSYTNLGTYSTTITHTADGSKSFTMSLNMYRCAYKQAPERLHGTLSETFTLDSIVRPAAISTATNFTDEENPTITYNNYSGSAVTTLQACIANSTGTVIYADYRDITKSGSSYTFNLTTAERAALRTAASTSSTLAVRFYVKTVASGNTFYRHLARTMTVSGSLAPTLNPTVTDTNSTTVALTGNNKILIPGFSNAYYSSGAAAQKEATITSQTVTCGSVKKTTGTGTFTAVEDYVFHFTCTDSRGNVATDTYEANSVPYFKVTCNQDVRLNLDGTVDLTITGNFFNGSFGAKDNTLDIQIRHREDGGAWGAWGSISPLISDISGGTYRLTAAISGYDPSGTHEFQSRAIDALYTANSADSAIVLKPIFDWGRNDFNFNVPLTIEGSPLKDFVVETGTEPMGTNGTWYWSKWKSGKAECYGCRNYGNMAVTTAWGGLYRSGAFTQSLPSGLFADTPEVIDISFRGGSNVGGWIANHENSAPSSSETGSFILVRPASATLTGSYLSFNVIGRWK